jgi:hypothetical protein
MTCLPDGAVPSPREASRIWLDMVGRASQVCFCGKGIAGLSCSKGE